jgi:hypothetical protein
MSVPRYSAPARGSLAVAWGIKKNQNRNCSEPSLNYEQIRSYSREKFENV